ncbi:hypothetical protein GCM10027592_60360 [Spirosoma flavus]
MSERTDPLLYTPFFPPSPVSKQTRNHNKKLFGEEPPKNPDWLLIFMGIVFLATLLIVWLVDIPSLIK